MIRQLTTTLLAATLLLATTHGDGGRIDFIGDPVAVPIFGAQLTVGNIDAVDDDNQRITGGTFSSSTPGVTITPNGDGSASVAIDPARFQVATALTGSHGKPTISVSFTVEGITFTCPLEIEIDRGFATITVGDNAQQTTTAVRSHFPDPTNLDGGTTDTAGNANDPVSTSTREFFFYQRLLDLNAPTLPLTFDIVHGSQLPDLLSFLHLPADFAHNHTLLARKIDAGFGFFQLQFDLGLGFRVSFQGTSPDWTLTEGHRWKFEVQETTNHYYLCDPSTHRVWIFEKRPNGTFIEPAVCLQVQDRNGNALTYTPHPDPTILGPASVTDGLGRSLTFTYAPVAGATNDLRPHLTTVTDHTGRSVTLTHTELDARAKLTTITDAIGGTYTHSYSPEGFLTARTLPNGNTPFTQNYATTPNFFFDGTLGVVTSQTDTFGHTTTFEDTDGIPGLGEKQVLITNPDASQRRHFHSDRNILTATVDETGALATFTADDANDLITGYTNRDGASGNYTYHPSGHIASTTDARGNTTTLTYTGSTPQTFQNPAIAETVQFTFPDLTRVDHADGTSQTISVDARGNRLTTTDRAGHTTTATVNTRGQQLTSSNPEGGTTTLTYDPSTGLVAALTDSETGDTTFTYDPLSRPVTITHPDSTTQTYTYDALGRLVTATDEENVTTTLTFDANSNITSLTRATGTPQQQAFNFAYDALDRPTNITVPTGDTIALGYGYHAQPESITFPDSGTIRIAYDVRRALTTIIDQLGATSSFTLTPSALVSATTTPEDRTTTFGRDPVGSVLQSTDASGDTTTTIRDAFSLPTTTADPLGRLTTLLRDPEGRITARTEPVLGTTTYGYDTNGNLTTLTDTRDNQWTSTFSPMGNRLSVNDPDDRSETRTYDNRGRLATVTHPDAVTETRSYHPDSRLASRSFSDGLNHTFTYDPLNRPTTTTRTLGARTDTITRTYDARSNIATTTTNGETTTSTHDNRNRLKTLTYPGGTTVTYTYDARGLVTRVTDSLTGTTIDFGYNADRQLTKTTRSNSRTTTRTYDAEGLPHTVAHDTGATITATFNRADELATLGRTGFPADGSAAITGATDTFTFNNSNEITNATFTYDDRGRPDNVTWDSDNRLVATAGTTPVTYRYSAHGHLTSRTAAGTTSDYLYSAAIHTSPIIGERSAGTYTRFYIPLPDGQVLYHIDDPTGTPAVRFHHHGQTGNVRFLTDATGNVTDSYAYDAYGRLLEKNGTSTQFYTYVGRYGVRTDPASGLLHMRQRYYDPQAGRFISRDPLFLQLMAASGLDSNPYHYTAGQPSFRADPSGLFPPLHLAQQWHEFMISLAESIVAEAKKAEAHSSAIAIAGFDAGDFDPLPPIFGLPQAFDPPGRPRGGAVRIGQDPNLVPPIAAEFVIGIDGRLSQVRRYPALGFNRDVQIRNEILDLEVRVGRLDNRIDDLEGTIVDTSLRGGTNFGQGLLRTILAFLENDMKGTQTILDQKTDALTPEQLRNLDF